MDKYIAEMLGTFVLVFINNGVVANVLLKKTKGNAQQQWMLITLAAGLAVTFGIFVAMFKSGAHINPAVSIAMLVIGKINMIDTIFYIIFQMIGGIIGALMVYLAYKKHYDATTDESLKLATFSTGPAIRNKKWNIITEILATFMLVGLVVTVTSPQVNLDDSLIPIVIGLLVMVLGISLGGSTGFAMNPARDLGPRITHSLLKLGNSDWTYAIIPVIGPVIGGILGAVVFSLYLGGL
ncbi:MIP/aquaporin family protein [Candidatus Izemoplasma sp. B36]|uniref:MIP/aquaporin family protein n=1 Tax=Candidatus Izemoplasma sp. B36 TaxID=3242468 RepID=UPI003555C56E